MPSSTVLPRNSNGAPVSTRALAKLDRCAISIAQADVQELESLAWMLEAAGYKVVSGGSGEAILRVFDPRLVGCLVLDLQLPDMTGTELLAQLRRRGCRQPYLITADQCDASVAVDLLQSGAIDLLVRPLREQRLLESVAKASRLHQHWKAVQTRLDKLSGREREILELVVAGLPTKQIARRLSISPRTVDVHRSNIGKKLEVSSFAALVQTITEHEMTRL
jgi:FixJ family two-component response regulator